MLWRARIGRLATAGSIAFVFISLAFTCYSVTLLHTAQPLVRDGLLRARETQGGGVFPPFEGSALRDTGSGRFRVRDSGGGSGGSGGAAPLNHPADLGATTAVGNTTITTAGGQSTGVNSEIAQPRGKESRFRQGLGEQRRTDSARESRNQRGGRQGNRDDQDLVHIVFSTDCSGYQHWQGIALWYSAQFAGQKGPITRIASGCDLGQQEVIAREWLAIDKSGRFRVHFTPPMELREGPHGGRKYPYSNKPGGLLHWLNNAAPPIGENVVVGLLDPDMLLLRPITAALAEGLTVSSRRGKAGKGQEELADAMGVGRALFVPQQRSVGAGSTAEGQLPKRVAKGQPAGQHFGIGGAWARAGTRAARRGSAWEAFSKAAVCGSAAAPCALATPREADTKFSVGPVYLAHVADWRAVAAQWWKMMPRVHDQYPQLLAEMYALTMAAANYTKPWALVSHFMVSDPRTNSPTEAWAWVEDLAAAPATLPSLSSSSVAVAAAVGPLGVCLGGSSWRLPSLTRRRSSLSSRPPPPGHEQHPSHELPHEDKAMPEIGGGESGGESGGSVGLGEEAPGASASLALPTVLHHCQKYKLAGQIFAKRKIPHDFFSCTGKPLPLDTGALLGALREAFQVTANSSSTAAVSAPPSALSGPSSTSWSPTQRSSYRSAFMLCHLVPLLNSALRAYQRDVCAPRP